MCRAQRFASHVEDRSLAAADLAVVLPSHRISAAEGHQGEGHSRALRDLGEVLGVVRNRYRDDPEGVRTEARTHGSAHPAGDPRAARSRCLGSGPVEVLEVVARSHCHAFLAAVGQAEEQTRSHVERVAAQAVAVHSHHDSAADVPVEDRTAHRTLRLHGLSEEDPVVVRIRGTDGRAVAQRGEARSHCYLGDPEEDQVVVHSCYRRCLGAAEDPAEVRTRSGSAVGGPAAVLEGVHGTRCAVREAEVVRKEEHILAGRLVDDLGADLEAAVRNHCCSYCSGRSADSALSARLSEVLSHCRHYRRSQASSSRQRRDEGPECPPLPCPCRRST